jgi:hypothetical protein
MSEALLSVSQSATAEAIEPDVVELDRRLGASALAVGAAAELRDL